MKIKLLLLFILIGSFYKAFADAFVPEFNMMKNLRCDFEETIFNSDNSVVSKSKQFRLFYLDDTYEKIYLQKEPIFKVTYYKNDRIEFDLESMTDDFIMMSHTIINRTTGEYFSSAELNYDNPIFGTRYSKSVGTCRFVN